MSKKLTILTFVFLALAVISLFAVDVAGEWELTSEGRQGPMTQAFKIVQDGEKISVTMEGRQGATITGEGTVKENAIEWTITRETPRGEFTSVYKGTVEGDTMSGMMSMSMGNMNEREWTAKKK